MKTTKSYIGRLTQSGLQEPQVNPFNNETRDYLGNIDYTTIANGQIKGYLKGAFPENDTLMPPQQTVWDSGNIFFIAKFERVDIDNIMIYTFTDNGDPIDLQGQTISFEIKVNI